MTTGRTATDDPLAARRTLAELERQKSTVLARQAKITAEREELAFDAAVGSAAAKQRLAALTKEAVAAAFEIEHAEAAIIQGRRYVAASDEAARLAELRARAVQARAKIIHLRQQGEAAGAALAAFGAAFSAFLAITDEVRKLGMGGPGRELVSASVRRVIQAELLQFHLQTEVIAPSDRRSLDQLVTAWAGAVEVRIAEHLGPDPDQEAA